MTPYFQAARHASREQNAYECMRNLAGAEHDFRQNDRDGNGVHDFWTADVAGLYKFGLIPKELAEADASPLHPLVPKPVPYKGYLFKALLSDLSALPPAEYRQWTDQASGKVHHLEKFGFVAFPADSLGPGYRLYIVNENNTVFPRAYTPAPPSDWPTDDELKSFYSKVQ